MHILIVEDGPFVADVLGMNLEEAGNFTSITRIIEVALAKLRHNDIYAVLLYINLPDGDGTRLARLIRKNHFPLPILVVSANASIDDKINALGAGADGYLTKPSDGFELLANLDAIVRRIHGHSSATVSVGNLEVDLNRHLALSNGVQEPLAAKKFRIVEFLALRKGLVLSNTAFLSLLYGGLDEQEPKIINIFMCKLRRKLELAGATGVNIDTVWVQGYSLRETHSRDGKAIPTATQITSIAEDEIDAVARANLPRQRPAAQKQMFSENSLREFHEETLAEQNMQADAT